MTRLDEIRARWAKATKSPWRANGGTTKAFVSGGPPESEVCTCWGGNNSDEHSALDDALAIASAPSDIAWLLAEVEMLRGIAVRDYSDTERTKRDAWREEHRHLDKYKGAIGGHITYTFTPTSIGTVKRMECACCKATGDITDYEDW